MKRKIKLFFAYIIALVFITFTYLPYSLLKWIFSLFKRIYLKIKKEVRFFM